MALKYRYAKKDEIPSELATHYVERDGGWVLDADGGAERGKLDEFRTTNVALMKELAEFKQRFDGIDPEEVRRRAQEKARLEEEQKLKAGEFDNFMS